MLLNHTSFKIHRDAFANAIVAVSVHCHLFLGVKIFSGKWLAVAFVLRFVTDISVVYLIFFYYKLVSFIIPVLV